MSDEMTTSKDVDLTGSYDKPGQQDAAGTHPASGASDPTVNANVNQTPNAEGAEAEDLSDNDYYSDENVQARREASGVEFVSHADVDPKLIKGSDGIPSNLRVGREGEVPEVRADLHTADGPRSEMQVDVHVNPDEVPTKDVGLGTELSAASQKPQLRPEESASDAPNKSNPDGPDELEVKGAEILSSAAERKDDSEFEGNVVVDDPDQPVYGHIAEDGSVHADNEPPASGEFVEAPELVDAELNPKVEEQVAQSSDPGQSGTDSHVAGH